MARRVCLISLLPLSTTGGGERYSKCAAASVSIAGDSCSVFSPAQPLPARSSLEERLAVQFVQIDPQQPHAQLRLLDFRSLLDFLADIDVVLLHQFLASDLTLDVIANVAGDQTLLFTTLGYETLRSVFEIIYQPSPNHFFIEISRFAAARSMVFSPRVMDVAGGIWQHELRSTPAPERCPVNLCAVGRVLPHKAFEVTIDALPPERQLSIVGPTNLDELYTNFLRRRAQGKAVTFLGPLDDSARDRVIASCGALIASSSTTTYTGGEYPQAELLGLVIFEALAQFCLPITSDLPPFAEVMANLGLSDWIYPQRDTEAARRLFCAAPTSGLVEQARERMVRRYDWNTYWRRVLNATVGE